MAIHAPGFASVVGSAVFGLAGDGVQVTPGLPFGLIQFAFFLFGQLFVGNKFLHDTNLLVCYEYIILENRRQDFKKP